MTFLIYYVRKFLNNSKQKKERRTTMLFNRLVVVVMLALAVFTPTAAIAGDGLVDGNVRLALHGTDGSGPVSLSGWVIAPNISQDSSKWFVAVGPQFNGKNWWLDLNAGALVINKKVVFVPEVRGSCTWEKYSFFSHLQWIDPGKSSQGGYFFLQGNRLIIKGIRLGIETENTWKHGGRSLAIGPQVVFVLGKHAAITASYQFVNQGKRHVWLRVAFSF